MSFSLVPVGSTIKRVYYAVAGHASIGPEFATFAEAKEHAVREWLAANARYSEGMVANVIHIDLRWDIEYPRTATGSFSGGEDAVIERIKLPAVQIAKVVEEFDLMRGPAAAARAAELGLRCIWDNERSVFQVARLKESVSA